MPTAPGLRWSAAAAALALLVAACGDGTGGDSPDRAEEPDSADPSETAQDDASAVGTRTVTFVDSTRPTPAIPERNVPGHDDRTIEVILQYPTSDSADDQDAPIVDAPPAAGRFPLVVFAHGLLADGLALERRTQHWAGAGYLVALPTFPLTSGPDAWVEDIVQQPADVSFVIDAVLALDANPDDPLQGHVDTEHVAAGGHSYGGTTTYGVAFNSCCIDERIDAAISLAGLEVSFPGGDYAHPPATPLLLVHGERDNLVAIGESSDAVWAKALPPVYYLRFTAGDHDNYLGRAASPGSQVRRHPAPREELAEVLDVAVVAFLDAHLRGDAEGLATLPTLTEESGLATFEARPSA